MAKKLREGVKYINERPEKKNSGKKALTNQRKRQSNFQYNGKGKCGKDRDRESISKK